MCAYASVHACWCGNQHGCAAICHCCYQHWKNKGKAGAQPLCLPLFWIDGLATGVLALADGDRNALWWLWHSVINKLQSSSMQNAWYSCVRAGVCVSSLCDQETRRQTMSHVDLKLPGGCCRQHDGCLGHSKVARACVWCDALQSNDTGTCVRTR